MSQGELLGFNIGGSHEQIDTHPATKKEKQKLSNAIETKILQEFLEI